MNCDVLIIGAGSAGCVLASRLSETASLNIILVESGEEPDDPRISDPSAWPMLQGSAIDWEFETTPQKKTAGRVHLWPRGRTVGGSSAMHAMGHMRGHPADFDAWDASGATGWNWQALLPYFVRSETSPFGLEVGYGDDGPVTLLQPDTPHPLTIAHQKAGIEFGLKPIRDHNGRDMAGPTINTLTLSDGKRQSVADAYLTSSVRQRRNLKILTGIQIDRLLFKSSGAVKGASGNRDHQTVEITANASVILAAGSIGSPSILLRSGIGDEAELSRTGIPLRTHAPGVGKNLQDHLLSAGNVYRANAQVPPTTTQHSESLTYIHSASQRIDAAPELVVGIVTVPIVTESLQSTPRIPEPGNGYTLMFGITHPRSRGSLWIQSPDPNAKPIIDPAYLSDTTDMQHFLEALDWARAIGGSASYDHWRAHEVLPTQAHLRSEDSKRDFIQQAAYTHHHPVGTCKMGSDSLAVVTPDLQVAAVSGLFIVDGSVFPSLTTGPVNAAIVAIAERASDLIIRKLRNA